MHLGFDETIQKNWIDSNDNSHRMYSAIVFQKNRQKQLVLLPMQSI